MKQYGLDFDDKSNPLSDAALLKGNAIKMIKEEYNWNTLMDSYKLMYVNSLI